MIVGLCAEVHFFDLHNIDCVGVTLKEDICSATTALNRFISCAQGIADRLNTVSLNCLGMASGVLHTLGGQIENNELKFSRNVCSVHVLLDKLNATISNPAEYWEDVSNQTGAVDAVSKQLLGLCITVMINLEITSVSTSSTGKNAIGSTVQNTTLSYFQPTKDLFEETSDKLRIFAPVAEVGYDLLKHFFKGDKWRVREMAQRALFSIQYEMDKFSNRNLVRLASQVSSNSYVKTDNLMKNYLEEPNDAIKDSKSTVYIARRQSAGDQIIKRTVEKISIEINSCISMAKAFEVHPQCQLLLNDPGLATQIKSALEKAWPSMETEAKVKVETKLKELNDLKLEISKCTEEKDKVKLVEIYEQEQSELHIRLKNLSGVESQLGVVISYLEGMRKDLVRMETKIDEIKATAENALHIIKDIHSSGPQRLIRNRDLCQFWGDYIGRNSSKTSCRLLSEAMFNWIRDLAEKGAISKGFSSSLRIDDILKIANYLDDDPRNESISVCEIDNYFPPSINLEETLKKLMTDAKSENATVMLQSRV